MQKTQEKTYLLTGGAGFIGGHLAHYLLKQGHRVIVLDNLSTGSYSNIEDLDQEYGPDGRFRFIFDTVLHDSIVEELVRESDAIFHLASAVGVKLIMDQPVQTIETIVGGTETVLRHAARYRKKTMVFSTSEVYGKSTDVPFREEGDRLEGPTTRHRWAYACAKALDEFIALAHWKQNRLPVIVVRLFNTVGPRQTGQYGMVVPNFVRQAMNNEPIYVYGTGDQSRCFCHVHDVVEAVTALMDTKGCTGEVFNVGHTREITIMQLAELVKKITKSDAEIRTIPYEEVFKGGGFEDMQRRMPCVDKIKGAIGWVPKRTLEQIIADVAEEMQRDAN
ncbi:GDP-mannose 4,6-dehydratase [bacterium]|nr:GDP-mannose 4,6-dehydratase [bacterium]